MHWTPILFFRCTVSDPRCSWRTALFFLCPVLVCVACMLVSSLSDDKFSLLQETFLEVVKQLIYPCTSFLAGNGISFHLVWLVPLGLTIPSLWPFGMVNCRYFLFGNSRCWQFSQWLPWVSFSANNRVKKICSVRYILQMTATILIHSQCWLDEWIYITQILTWHGWSFKVDMLETENWLVCVTYISNVTNVTGLSRYFLSRILPRL